MTKKEKETILKAVENAYYWSYKKENPSTVAKAVALASLALDLGMDAGVITHRARLGKVAALGLEEKTA